MESFDAHKWFKKQYLEEAKIDEAMMSREEAFEALRDVLKRGNVDDSYAMKMRMALDSLQADEIRVMMDREKANKSVTFSDVREDDSEENKLYPDYDDIIEFIKNKSNKNNSSEIDEAIDVMEFIGQHYGINIEFTRF